MLDGSSQWVIGKTVTQNSAILHLTKNALQFDNGNDIDYILMVNHDRLAYILLSSFAPKVEDTTILFGLNGRLLADKTCAEVKAVLDRVH